MSEIGLSRMIGGWLSRYSSACCLSGISETIRRFVGGALHGPSLRIDAKFLPTT
jgi:hypothetical protein